MGLATMTGLILVLLATRAWPQSAQGGIDGSAYHTDVRPGRVSLPTIGGAWTELTALPYDLEDRRHANYEDYYYRSGYGLAGGRVQALAVDGDTVYAGAAGGGVWRSDDRGETWIPLTDDLPSLSSGALAVDPTNGDVWYGTGDAAMGETARSYRGVGVFRSSDRGDTWQLIGGDELDQSMIAAIELDGIGNVYAATTAGLYRGSISSPASEPWSLVLRPGTPGPYGFTFVNDVVVRPGTDGRVVVAALGWPRDDVDHNGLYVSHDFGQEGTWERVATRGQLDVDKIGRASLAYSSDGLRLYALVSSWGKYVKGEASSLYGAFLSPEGTVRGPWTKIAGAHTFQNAKGSFTAINAAFSPPGRLAYFNQAIGVDPADRDHLYVGLEELYETTDAGQTWIAAGGNYCGVGTLDLCKGTAKTIEHALAFGDGVVYSGTNGGVYRRRLTRHSVGGWVNLNRDLRALPYHSVGVGNSAGGDVTWGGTYDLGLSLLRAGASRMVATHCCSVFQMIVDPSNPDRVAIVHLDNEMLITTNGGLTGGFHAADPLGPLPSTRYAVLRADPTDPNRHWVFGARWVSETRKGWRTKGPVMLGCLETPDECDWQRLHEVGAGNMVTTLDVLGDTIYVAWCGSTFCDPDPSFASGIDTNAGGEWHRVVGPGTLNGGDPLPNRWINSIQIDPADPNHVYVMYGGYRRTWNFETGAGGHVFESKDAGETWTDISGDLPDAAATDLLVVGDRLVLAMDAGVFVANAANPTNWANLGTRIPNAAVTDLTLTPDGGSVVAATYGRGLWSIEAP
jgi:hypothetical protein